jgi:uncharacterized membrane protein
VTTSRLESFSDGVIAVAITLLVLNLVVPPPGGDHHSLAYNLGHMWPQYVGYATSFVTIGIIWINHHYMISRLAQAGRTIMLLNLLLLLFIGVLPFGTNLMATYLKESRGESLAAAVWAGLFLAMSISFATLNRHILLRKAHLLGQELSEARRRKILARSVVGLAPYAVATVIAALSPYATLIICAAVAVFYALPIGSGGVEEG